MSGAWTVGGSGMLPFFPRNLERAGYLMKILITARTKAGLDVGRSEGY